MVRFEQDVVGEYLEAAHAVGNHLLEVFTRACAEAGVRYFVTSGTLLGAVRSGSWIPWDDDVDVIMFREDYERLVPLIGDHLPENVAFSSPETRADHITAIPRIVYLDSHRVHVGRNRSRVPIETKHIPLDIFILDQGPRRPRLRRLWSLLALGLDKAAVARYTSVRDVVDETEIGPGRKLMELCGVVLSRVMSRDRWHRLRTWVVTRPARRKDASGPYVATNYSTPAGRRMSFEKDWYLPAGTVEFAGRTYPAPGDQAAVLTELYGPDYLTPPAAADRQPVHIRGGLHASLDGREWQIAPRDDATAGAVLDMPPPVPPDLEFDADFDAATDPGVVAGDGDGAPKSFGHQVAWAMVARISSSVLQILVLVLLARGLAPHNFAVIISVNVVLQVTVAVNGFGLLRQIEYRRSRNRGDPSLASLFEMRLRFSYASAIVWVAGCLVAYAVNGNWVFLALLPAAIWLLVEQTTQVWNGVSVVDGKTFNLIGSYLTRRAPVVVFLAVALWWDHSMVWAWSLGLAAGSFLSYAEGYRKQEPWARVMFPRRGGVHMKVPFDLGYWWGLVGQQLKDFDVAAVSAVSSVAGGYYAFPARLVAPMNLVTVAAASSAFPRVARAGGLTRHNLRLGVTLGLVPVILVATTVALLSPLLPVLLGEAYEGSVAVMRVTCITAVMSGAATMVAIMLQAHSSEAARTMGYLSLGFAICQVTGAAIGASIDGALGAATVVAVLNALVAAVVFVLAYRWAVP